MSHDDPEEFVGNTQERKADPKGSKHTVVAPVKPVAAPVKVAVAPTPEVKPGSHPKHAVERPRREYEAAQQETQEAHAELRQAGDALHEAGAREDDALAHWLALQPVVDPDQLLRDYGKQQTAQRAANVAAGLPPEGVRAPSYSDSPLDRAAAQRPRTSPQAANQPLRSPVARRLA